MKSVKIFLMVMMAMILPLASCSQTSEEASNNPTIPNIIFIGLDGWGSYSYDKADMPTVKNLAANGCYTLEKRTVLPSSSAPNWASMFMGAGPELHGYTQWGSQIPELPSRVVNEHGIFPTIFQVYRDANPNAEIGVMYEWDGIKHLVDTLSLSYYEGVEDFVNNPTALCEMSEKYIKEKHPNLMAIIYDCPDHVGHAVGHDTEAYYENLAELDGYVARIIKAVEDAGMAENTIFIVTSDHGGINTGHGGITMEEMRTPFIISGPGIKNGAEIESSMMQYDVAATMAAILGVKAPQVWIGRPMDVIL